MGSDFAYYFGDWIWPDQSSDLMKSMLLFFDGITVALPSEVADQMIERDPVLAGPLHDKGLLVNFDPADTLDADQAERLASSLTELIHQHPQLWQSGSATFPGPSQNDIGTGHYGRISLERLSTHMLNQTPHGAVTELERVLRQRGLLTGDPDACVVQMDPATRLLVLTGFAQTLRAQLQRQHVNLHPITDSASVIDWLVQQLHGYTPTNTPALSTAEQFRTDLATVGADLSPVPLDEVLSYRQDHGQQYRTYAKSLRDFLTSQADAPTSERRRALDDRRQEILDQAADLRRLSRKTFGMRATALVLSLAGSAWTIRNGDPIGALLAASAAVSQAIPTPTPNVTAYSYLLEMRTLAT